MAYVRREDEPVKAEEATIAGEMLRGGLALAAGREALGQAHVVGSAARR
jgi:hypothetical protein